jgi:hypothetical protein
MTLCTLVNTVVSEELPAFVIRVDLGLFEDGCFSLLWTVRNCLPTCTASHPRTHESPSEPLWEPKISHERFLSLCCQFDVARWLVIRRPRLSERSQFIELVGKALTAAGLNPEEDKLMLHEVCVFNVLWGMKRWSLQRHVMLHLSLHRHIMQH